MALTGKDRIDPILARIARLESERDEAAAQARAFLRHAQRQRDALGGWSAVQRDQQYAQIREKVESQPL